MAEANSSSKKGLTPRKAILIGFLSVVLVVILYVQFGGEAAKPAGEVTKYRPPRPAVAVQPLNSSGSPVTLASATTPANTLTNKDTKLVAPRLIDETRWKSPKLATVVAYDPFALPSAFPQQPKGIQDPKAKGADGLIAAVAADDAKKLAEAVEQLHMQLEELRQRGVHVITRQDGKWVAWIGERKLQVGDTINGFTVTAIDPDDGVHVERKESP